MGLTDNFDRHNRKDTGEEQKTDTKASKHSASGVRNLCFIQPDGRRLFLNYAYLISGEYVPEDSTITLTFTTHIVTIKGHNLEPIQRSLEAHEPSEIMCMDERYERMADETKTVVTEIDVRKN